MGSFVAGLDATAVNVALPAIRADLGGGLAGQQWVSNAYPLALGSLILVGGSLGDLFGERRVFSIGVLTVYLDQHARDGVIRRDAPAAVSLIAASERFS
jgi:MFS family permease